MQHETPSINPLWNNGKYSQGPPVAANMYTGLSTAESPPASRSHCWTVSQQTLSCAMTRVNISCGEHLDLGSCQKRLYYVCSLAHVHTCTFNHFYFQVLILSLIVKGLLVQSSSDRRPLRWVIGLSSFKTSSTCHISCVKGDVQDSMLCLIIHVDM